jgi:hypothetical protein
MSVALLKTYLPGGPALVATIGFGPCGCGERCAPLPSLGRQVVTVDLDEVSADDPITDVPTKVVAVYARSYTDLRRAVTLSGLLPETAHLVVVVAETSRYRLLGLPAASPEWPPVQRIHAYQHPTDGWTAEFRLRKAAAPGQFLTAITRAIGQPRRRLSPKVALTGPGAAHWRPGDAGAILATTQGPLGEPDEYLPADLVLRTVDEDDVGWTDPRVAVVDRDRPGRRDWATLGRGESATAIGELHDVDSVAPIDELSVNPIGFVARDTKEIGELAQHGDHWAITAPGLHLMVPASGAITDSDVAKLRPLRGVAVDWGRHTGPLEAVRSIAGLAAAGVPLLSARRPPEWARALGPELIDLLGGVGDDDLADDVRREEHSIRLRRAAFRTHSTAVRWGNLAAASKVPVRRPPKISVILCTKRPEFIPFALTQIARQRHVDLEVILILHGLPEDLPDVRAVVDRFAHPITTVRVPDDVIFGEALNRGTEAASGDYLTKWDDDDWYSPDHLSDMLMAESYSGADLIGCVHQYIYLEQINLTVFRPSGEPERFTRHVAGGTLLIDRHTFNDVGRFRGLPRQVDRSLLLAVASAGGRTYRTHGLGYVLHRRPSGHTWNQPVTHFLRNTARQRHGFQPGRLLELDELRRDLAELKGSLPYHV